MTLEELTLTHKYAREHAGISLVKQAERIGCAKNTLFNFEAHNRSINIDTLLRSLEALGVHLSINPGNDVTWYEDVPYPSDEDDSISEPLLTKDADGNVLIQRFYFDTMSWDCDDAEDNWDPEFTKVTAWAFLPEPSAEDEEEEE